MIVSIKKKARLDNQYCLIIQLFYSKTIYITDIVAFADLIPIEVYPTE